MKLRFTMVLAVAVMLAGAGISYGVPEAWGGGFSGGRPQPAASAAAACAASAAARAAWARCEGCAATDFQRGRRNNITRYHLNNSHVKSGRTGGTNRTSDKGDKVKSLQAGQKNALAGKPVKFGKPLSFKNPQVKKANFSKPNIWSNKQWGGKGWHHHDRCPVGMAPYSGPTSSATISATASGPAIAPTSIGAMAPT